MTIELEILQYLHFHLLANRTEITKGISNAPSDSSMKRVIASAIDNGYMEAVGRGHATKYKLMKPPTTSAPAYAVWEW